MQSHRRSRSARVAATVLGVAALAAPAASASPIIDPGTSQPAAAPSSPRVVVRSVDSGFDWGSAGVGAGATAGLVLVSAGAFGASYRGRIRLAR
jgi:hypothetical protein